MNLTTTQTKLIAGTNRLQSIDLLRGAIMVLMAIDHVRVYAGVPAGGPDPGVFFTRWITHFCVPGFVFLAGMSAFLNGKKLGESTPGITPTLARYLLTRGLLLIILELTLIRFTWTFNLAYTEFVLAGVIWILGWCMVILALLVRLRPLVVGIIGVVILAFQQVFAWLPGLLPPAMREWAGWFWAFIYPSELPAWSGMAILYVLVPWIGVMAAGYGFGQLIEPARRTHAYRRRICLRIGLSAIALFVVVGSSLVLSQSAPPDAPPFLFQLLNQRKYPASQLYLLMTLGPLVALIPFTDKARGWLANLLTTFGRVPLFYYLLHIPLIHLLALLVNLIRTGSGHGEWYTTAPFAAVPAEQQWPLALLYGVFAVVVALLYVACRWYAGYKSAHSETPWLTYL